MKKFRKWIPLFLFLGLLPALLTGCNPESGTSYEIIYPSGLSRGPCDWEDVVPVEGAPYQLTSGKSENFEKNRSYDLWVLDENGEVLYEYPELGHSVVRGESGDQENTVWVSCELWNTPHHSGYLNGCLKESTLLLLDMETGDILFQAEVGENECYITSRETRCYFYKPGEPESEKLFGLLKTPAQSAELYYRDTGDWAKPHTVYTFDYDSGWSSEADEAAFDNECCGLFQQLGWTLHPGSNGGCDTVTKDRQDLYLHPFNFSGVMDEASIQPLQEQLSKGKTFRCYAVDCYEEYADLSDEEYRAALDAKREEITAFILEQCRTKRTNLYITGSVALHFAKHFEIHCLCDRDGCNAVGNRFMSELIDQLLQEGRLVSTETTHGTAIRTATVRELKDYRKPVEQVAGQFTMM